MNFLFCNWRFGISKMFPAEFSYLQNYIRINISDNWGAVFKERNFKCLKLLIVLDSFLKTLKILKLLS